jgi:hypothetical protein
MLLPVLHARLLRPQAFAAHRAVVAHLHRRLLRLGGMGVERQRRQQEREWKRQRRRISMEFWWRLQTIRAGAQVQGERLQQRMQLRSSMASTVTGTSPAAEIVRAMHAPTLPLLVCVPSGFVCGVRTCSFVCVRVGCRGGGCGWDCGIAADLVLVLVRLLRRGRHGERGQRQGGGRRCARCRVVGRGRLGSLARRV